MFSFVIAKDIAWVLGGRIFSQQILKEYPHPSEEEGDAYPESILFTIDQNYFFRCVAISFQNPELF